MDSANISTCDQSGCLTENNTPALFNFLRSETFSSAGTFVSFHNLRYSVLIKNKAQPTSVFLRNNKKKSENLHLKQPNVANVNRKNVIEKVILKSVTGCFRPGRVTAILGPSGCGKTSLLTAMGGLLKKGNLHGEIKVNGKVCSKKVLRALSGFVYQDDVILSTMTVEEALRMALILRTEDLTEDQIQRRIKIVCDTLLLANARKTMIGSTTCKGVSGGERKRTAIGMEVVAGSPVLLLDECTSGLDSFSAYSVMCTLRSITTNGTTIVASLHQPSSEIFEVLDDVIILVAGEIIYMGPTEKMVEYFSKLGYICPQFNNPPDFVFMKIIGTKKSDNLRNLIEKATVNGSEWLSSAIATSNHDIEAANDNSLAAVRFKYIPNARKQFTYLTRRNFLNLFRNPMLLKARCGQMLFLAFLIGASFFKIETRGNQSQFVKNVSGALFFTAANLFTVQSIAMMSTFSSERHVFLREYASGYYSVLSYFLSKIIVELPAQIILSCLFAIITYFLIGFTNTTSKFFVYMYLCVLQSFVGSSCGLLIAASFEDLGVGLTILPLSIQPIVLLGGLMVANEVASKWLSWIQWISPVQYMFTAQMFNYLNERILKLKLNNEEITINGNKVLEDNGFQLRYGVTISTAILFSIICMTGTFAYFALHRLAIRSNGDPFLSKKKKKKWAKNII